MAELERAILAGGCFWGMQDLIRKLPGVTGTRVGYTGGDVPNATYRNHGTHAEGIEIIFDPAKISYRELLESSANSLKWCPMRCTATGCWVRSPTRRWRPSRPTTAAACTTASPDFRAKW